MFEDLQAVKGIHPGIFLERELKKRNIRKGNFALSLMEYPQTMVSITKGKRRMNVSLAIKIEQNLGLQEGTLMMLQVFYDILQEKKSRQLMTPNLEIFRPILFWDTDIKKIDWEKQKNQVIKRILERGNTTEIQEIERFYGKEIVANIRKDGC